MKANQIKYQIARIANAAPFLILYESAPYEIEAWLSLREEYSDIENKEGYPLEHVDKIVFNDKKGLENLLTETSKGKNGEWATFIKAHEKNGTAFIDEVLPPEESKRNGFSQRRTNHSMAINIDSAEKEGYTGVSHYHSLNGVQNFIINYADRWMPQNWINFITFNLDNKSEIVGYNRQNTYIPKEKNRKDILITAGPKQVMQYLG